MSKYSDALGPPRGQVRACDGPTVDSEMASGMASVQAIHRAPATSKRIPAPSLDPADGAPHGPVGHKGRAAARERRLTPPEPTRRSFELAAGGCEDLTPLVYIRLFAT